MTDLFTCLNRLSLQNLKTAKIGICTPLKSKFPPQFVSERIGIEPITFHSRMQNLVKISKIAYAIIPELTKSTVKPEFAPL